MDEWQDHDRGRRFADDAFGGAHRERQQVGEFMGIPAGGRSYTIGEIHLFRIRDDKVIEHWHQFDLPGMMRQLGATPGG